MICYKCDICKKEIEIIEGRRHINSVWPKDIFKEVCDGCLVKFNTLVKKQEEEIRLIKKRHTQEMKQLAKDKVN